MNFTLAMIVLEKLSIVIGINSSESKKALLRVPFCFILLLGNMVKDQRSTAKNHPKKRGWLR